MNYQEVVKLVGLMSLDSVVAVLSGPIYDCLLLKYVDVELALLVST